MPKGTQSGIEKGYTVMISLFDIKIGDVLDELPHECKELGNIRLSVSESDSLKLGYAIFGFPVTQHKCYFVFKYLDKDNLKQSRVKYLGEYRYLKHVTYWIENDLYNNREI